MDFQEFQQLNATRCNTKFHPLNSWTISDWAVAIAGEAGELCNIVKKVRRGDFTLEVARQDILREVADIITYCDLLMSRLNADTEDEVMKKFDEVSKRVNFEW